MDIATTKPLSVYKAKRHGYNYITKYFPKSHLALEHDAWRYLNPREQQLKTWEKNTEMNNVTTCIIYNLVQFHL